MKKLVTEEELEKILCNSRKSTAFASGVFDLLHDGHRLYLSEAKKQADILVVFVHTDASTKRMKSQDRPIHSQLARAENIAKLKCVDYVILFNEESPYRILSKYKPNVMARSGAPKDTKMKCFVEAYGGKAFYAAVLHGVSTTKLIEDGKRLLQNTGR